MTVSPPTPDSLDVTASAARATCMRFGNRCTFKSMIPIESCKTAQRRPHVGEGHVIG